MHKVTDHTLSCSRQTFVSSLQA